MAKESPFAVQVPAAGQDKPAWVKVGMIAAVGFVVGIAWPRLVGVRPGPQAPGESVASSSASHGGRAPDAPPATVTKPVASASAPVAAGSAPPPAANANATLSPPSISVQKGTVVSCKTTDGETKKGSKCGEVPGIDAIVSPRVRKIATCSGVEGQTGKLSLTVNADFGSGRFWYDVNKTSTVQNLDAVANCLKTSFHNTSATSTPHEHPRYTVSYVAIFAPATSGAAPDELADKGSAHSEKGAKEAPADDKSAAPAAASNAGEASVAWEVALVRDTPKTGALVGRLPRGSKVKVGASKDGWYAIKFGDGFASDGWVYRGAIGR